MSEVQTDFSYLRRRVSAAMEGIAAGKGLEAFAPVWGDYGRNTNIGRALVDGANQLHEPFDNEDEWNLARRAFRQLGLTPPSRQKSLCCEALIKALA